MSSAPCPPPSLDEPSLRRLAARLRAAVTLLTAGTAALFLYPLLLSAVFRRVPDNPAGWAELLPSLVYLWGLLRLRGALATIAAGDLFGPAAAAALRDLGAALVVGVALDILILPNLLFWTLGPGHGGLLRFDVGDFATAAIGASLVLVARLFGAAAAMRADLDGIL